MRQSDINIRAAEAEPRGKLRQPGLFLHLRRGRWNCLPDFCRLPIKIRPESREIIERLRAMGIRNSVMLTGDNAVVARAVGWRLGLSNPGSPTCCRRTKPR